MIISRGRKYIFVHIPKTGGTSLALALEDRAMKDDIMLGDTPKAVKRRRKVKGIETSGRLWKHSGLADIDGLVSTEEIAQMFTFTLVRNPWDRVVSYYHWLQGQEFDHPAVQISKELKFGDFLRHRLTMSTLIAWPYGRYMRAVDGGERGVFLRLEHLENDIKPLETHLGFRPDMPHENRSARGDYRRYYDEGLRDLLGRLCAEDIARFGYEF